MEVARFYWRDYIHVYELPYAIEELTDIISRIRGWEGIRSQSIKEKRISYETVDKLVLELVGITDEWTEEYLVVKYKNGLVTVERK